MSRNRKHPLRTSGRKRAEVADIVCDAEICTAHGLTPSQFANWLNRYETFPRPLKVLASGPIFSRREVDAWIDANTKAAPAKMHAKRGAK